MSTTWEPIFFALLDRPDYQKSGEENPLAWLSEISAYVKQLHEDFAMVSGGMRIIEYSGKLVWLNFKILIQIYYRSHFSSYDRTDSSDTTLSAPGSNK